MNNDEAAPNAFICERGMRAASRAVIYIASVVVWSGCAAPVAPRPRAKAASSSEFETRAQLIQELQSDILSSYARADSLAFEQTPVARGLFDPNVGEARIGAGPDDVVYGADVGTHAWKRWPFRVVPGTKIAVVSKRLDVHLDAGPRVTSAWSSDEVSWEIQVCGKTAAIPLRITALYARDGDQWAKVFEHVSYGRPAVAYPELRGARIADAFADPQLADYPLGTLGAPLAALLSGDPEREHAVVELDPSHKTELDSTLPAPTFVLAPGYRSEWHGEEDVSRIHLGVHDLLPEDRRLSFVGNTGTMAYWIGNFVGELPSPQGTPGARVRLRGTFIFEKRCTHRTPKCEPDRWFVVQAHLSEAIDADELARIGFGSALVSVDPLQLGCKR